MSEEAEWRGGGLLATCGVVWRSDGVTMVRINACDRPISVTASQRLNGVSPNPNPRSVEVGDILLCPPELGLRGPSTPRVRTRVHPTLCVLVLLGVLGRFGTWYLRVFPVV